MTIPMASPRSSSRGKILDGLTNLFLVFLLLIGVYFRFNWGAWNQGTNLHPDEYGLTNTLTQLKLPNNWSDYFNTRISPLSPYPQYGTDGQALKDGPDNRLRWGQWPITLIRAAGEATGQIGYDEIRLLGRKLSALADTLSLALIFLIGRRLYGWRIGLLAAALSSLAVMQIQQSHFMTVDNFGVFFTTLAMYACVRIAQEPCTQRSVGSLPGFVAKTQLYRPNPAALQWYLLFGVSFGMAVASRINLLPLGGMVLIAALIGMADQKLKLRSDLPRILGFAALYLVIAVMTSLVTFRVTQPMSFRALSGDTTLLSLHLNPDWMESMRVAQNESNGIGGGPPAEQWAHRPAILFPLTNMVLWGMGLALGIAAWAGLLWALWRSLRGEGWRVHLLPLVWTGGYFLFMGTRWVKSVRYFLPVYPFLCLFAAWGLLQLWRRRSNRPDGILSPPTWSRPWWLGLVCFGAVTLGTLAWANAFVSAVYRVDHTRIQATRWIFQNVPAPFHLALSGLHGQVTYEPVPAPDRLQIASPFAFTQSFTAAASGSLKSILIPHAISDGAPARLRVVIASDPDGKVVIAATELNILTAAQDASWPQARADFQQGRLEAGQTYYLQASAIGSQRVSIARSVVSNEDWDEGLPVPFDGRDPFGGLYHGLEMNVRWADDENKRQMFLDNLAQVDYIILPSQRGIWSTCRLPLTYPMTMAYYRALFDGQLGFTQVAQFSAPLQLGPLSISDVGGALAWGKKAPLPLFNHSFLAAEEAFSVYDHPPVWIFKKRPDFNLQAVKDILNSIDLSQVIVQSPVDATGNYCP